jgi:hypothetical protein
LDLHSQEWDRQGNLDLPASLLDERLHRLGAPRAAGTEIGELPAVVEPGLIREGHLVEVMPDWRFRTHDLSLVQVGNRHITKPCRLFKDLAVQMAPSLFPVLPK